MKHIVVKSLALIAPACSLTTTARAQSFAKRVDIGGRRMMYIECQGSGSPTVVLMSGAGATGLLAVGGASLVYAGYPADPFA